MKLIHKYTKLIRYAIALMTLIILPEFLII